MEFWGVPTWEGFLQAFSLRLKTHVSPCEVLSVNHLFHTAAMERFDLTHRKRRICRPWRCIPCLCLRGAKGRWAWQLSSTCPLMIIQRAYTKMLDFSKQSQLTEAGLAAGFSSTSSSSSSSSSSNDNMPLFWDIVLQPRGLSNNTDVIGRPNFKRAEEEWAVAWDDSAF